MKTLLYIMSLCAAYIFLSVQFDVLAQSSSPAATRAYCDNNRNVAVQMAVQNMSTNLQPMVSQEVERVSQSFVTNAYPVPVPVTNTVYVETVVSNQIIYQTTQVAVYSTYLITTNVYLTEETNVSVNITTNFITDIDYRTNITYQMGTNAILPNAEGSNWNFMVSDNMEYDLMFATNSHGMNISFGRTYNDFYGLLPRYMYETNYILFGEFHVNIPENLYYTEAVYQSHYIHSALITNYLIRTYGFQADNNDSIYLGKNIFNLSIFNFSMTNLDNSVNPFIENYDYFDIPNAIVSMTNRNIVIGNDIAPCFDEDYHFLHWNMIEEPLGIDGSIIISADHHNSSLTNSTERPKNIKRITGFKNCILLDAINTEEGNYQSSGLTYIGERNTPRLKNKICLSVNGGMNDIMILNGEGKYNQFVSLSDLIGQMVTNIVNQMRPQ